MCPDCGLEVETRNDLIRHMRSTHQNRRAPHTGYGLATKCFRNKWRGNRGRIEARGVKVHRRQHGCRPSRSRSRDSRKVKREERKEVKKGKDEKKEMQKTEITKGKDEKKEVKKGKDTKEKGSDKTTGMESDEGESGVWEEMKEDDEVSIHAGSLSEGDEENEAEEEKHEEKEEDEEKKRKEMEEKAEEKKREEMENKAEEKKHEDKEKDEEKKREEMKNKAEEKKSGEENKDKENKDKKEDDNNDVKKEDKGQKQRNGDGVRDAALPPRTLKKKARWEVDMDEDSEEEEIIIRLKKPRLGFRRITRIDVTSQIFVRAYGTTKLVREIKDSSFPDELMDLTEE